MPANIEYNNLTITEVMADLDKRGIVGSDAHVVAAGWILENLRRTRRHFSYKESFPASVPACMPDPFVRQFQHQNWVDGEDLVQAGDANGKEGFNARFHKIEADLDKLGANIAILAGCMADLRLSISKCLEEIRVEINVLNSKVFEGGFDFELEPFPLPHTKFLTPGPKFLGTSKILGEERMMWQTDAGIMSLPLVSTPTSGGGPGRRATFPGALAEFMQKDAVKARFPQEVTVPKLIEAFGESEIMPGVTVREAVEVLPERGRYANTAAMTADLAERTALSLKMTNNADAALTSMTGLDVASGGGADLSVSDMQWMSKDVRATLVRNNIKTMKDLAAADPAAVAEMMRTAGVESSVGAAAGLVTNAGLVGRLATRRVG